MAAISGSPRNFLPYVNAANRLQTFHQFDKHVLAVPSNNKEGGSFLSHPSLQYVRTSRRPKMDFVVRGTPDPGHFLSFWPTDNPWMTGIAGFLVTVPFLTQRLLTLTKEIDFAAQTVEKIADAVEHVAEEVDKAAEEIGEALPEGGLKKMVHFVENLAEETAKDAHKVEELMDKIEELDEKVEAYFNHRPTGSEKASTDKV